VNSKKHTWDPKAPGCDLLGNPDAPSYVPPDGEHSSAAALTCYSAR